MATGDGLLELHKYFRLLNADLLKEGQRWGLDLFKFDNVRTILYLTLCTLFIIFQVN